MAAIIDKAIQVFTGRGDQDVIKAVSPNLDAHYKKVIGAPSEGVYKRGALLRKIKDLSGATHPAHLAQLEQLQADLQRVDAENEAASKAYEQRFIIEALNKKGRLLAQMEEFGLGQHESTVQQHQREVTELVKRSSALKKEEARVRADHTKASRDRNARVERLSAAHEQKINEFTASQKHVEDARRDAAETYAKAVADGLDTPSVEPAEKAISGAAVAAIRARDQADALGGELSRTREEAASADRAAAAEITHIQEEIRSLETQAAQLSWDIGAARMVFAAVNAADHMPRHLREKLSIPFFDAKRVHGGFLVGHHRSCIDGDHILEMAKALKAGTVSDFLDELRAAGLGHLIP